MVSQNENFRDSSKIYHGKGLETAYRDIKNGNTSRFLCIIKWITLAMFVIEQLKSNLKENVFRVLHTTNLKTYTNKTHYPRTDFFDIDENLPQTSKNSL